MRNAGYYAIESLRLEKGYRAWGRELTPDYNPYEAGLGFAVKLDKGDFLGRDALRRREGEAADAAAARASSRVAPTRRSRMAASSILRNGEPVGEVTSAAYGHTVGGIVALGYVATGGARVDDAWLAARFELDIAGERVPCAQASRRRTIRHRRARACNRDRLAAHNSPHAEVPPRSGGLEARSGGEALHRQGCVLRGSPPARTSG